MGVGEEVCGGGDGRSLNKHNHENIVESFKMWVMLF